MTILLHAVITDIFFPYMQRIAYYHNALMFFDLLIVFAFQQKM